MTLPTPFDLKMVFVLVDLVWWLMLPLIFDMVRYGIYPPVVLAAYAVAVIVAHVCT